MFYSKEEFIINMVKKRYGWIRNYSNLAILRIQNHECPSCGKHKNKWARRTDWTCCSKECTDKFHKQAIIQDWSVIRAQAFKRDNYTCKYCGKRFALKYDNIEIANSSKLIGDHIIPIAVGGEEFDIDNVQTLCVDCNKIKTKRDMRIIAKYRKREKELKYGIDLIKVSFPLQKTLMEENYA